MKQHGSYGAGRAFVPNAFDVALVQRRRFGLEHLPRCYGGAVPALRIRVEPRFGLYPASLKTGPPLRRGSSEPGPDRTARAGTSSDLTQREQSDTQSSRKGFNWAFGRQAQPPGTLPIVSVATSIHPTTGRDSEIQHCGRCASLSALCRQSVSKANAGRANARQNVLAMIGLSPPSHARPVCGRLE